MHMVVLGSAVKCLWLALGGPILALAAQLGLENATFTLLVRALFLASKVACALTVACWLRIMTITSLIISGHG